MDILIPTHIARHCPLSFFCDKTHQLQPGETTLWDIFAIVHDFEYILRMQWLGVHTQPLHPGNPRGNFARETEVIGPLKFTL